MKSGKATLILAVFVMTLFAFGVSSAHGFYRGGGHSRGHYRGGVDVVIGGPVWGPSWYYPPFYYYPNYYPYHYSPTVPVPSTPPAYIEQSEPEPSAAPSGVWYYCPESEGYYPYVKECPGGWQTVPAEPPSGTER